MINPADYYFQREQTDPNDTTFGISEYFMITPVSYFDKNGCLYDDDMPKLEAFLEQRFFTRLMESTFEYEDKGNGRSVLIALGFKEHKLI